MLVLLLVGLLLQLGFIFSNSHKNAEDSNQQSSVYVRLYVEKIQGEAYDTLPQERIDRITHGIRKAAHFTEYAVLCMLAAGIWLAAGGKGRGIDVLLPPCFGFFVGLCDEYSQSFSKGRSNQFSDVLLDTAGGVFGCAAVFLAVWLIRKLVFKHKKDIRQRGKNEFI